MTENKKTNKKTGRKTRKKTSKPTGDVTVVESKFWETTGSGIVIIYMVGYWFYLLSTIYLAFPKLSWFGWGEFAIPQSLISILWPLWLWLGYRPLMP